MSLIYIILFYGPRKRNQILREKAYEKIEVLKDYQKLSDGGYKKVPNITRKLVTILMQNEIFKILILKFIFYARQVPTQYRN